MKLYMEEDFLNNKLIEQFETMLENNENHYFDTDDFYDIIAFYLDVGDLQYAKKAIDLAVAQHPDSIEIKIKKLEYYLAVNRLKAAAVLIDELKLLGHNDIDFILCMAKFWSLKGNHNKAISFYEEALQFEEDLDYIHNCLGNEYLGINELSKALFHFKKALEYNLDDEYALYSCVQCFTDMHLHGECIEFLNQYIDLRPYSENAWFQLGQEYVSLKNYEEALRAFDFAIVINPNSVSNYTQKANCLEKLEDYEKAISVYEDTLEIDDSAAFAYLKIGHCYNKLGKPFKALKAFQKSLHEDPQMDKTWVAASDLYDSLGNYEEAMYYLERGMELEGSNVDYWKRHAYLNIQLRMFEESSLDYFKLVELEPNNFFNWLGLAETLITIGDYLKAIIAINEGLKHFERAELYYQLSNCYFLINNEKLGLEAYKHAVEMNPKLAIDMLKKYPIIEARIALKAFNKKDQKL